MSAKERIERYPQIDKLEMQWIRANFGELFPFATNRERFFVEDPDFIDLKFRSRIHTHICNPKCHVNKVTPSLGDLYYILVDIDQNNIRNWDIIGINIRGKVTGYFCMRATQTMENAVKKRSDEERALFNEISGYLWWGPPEGKTTEQVDIELLEKFKKLGLSIKAIPMEGYFFDGQRFVRKN